jgi:hypothetical protein
MGKFSERLLTDLMTEYRPVLEATEPPETATVRRSRSRRPRWMAAAAVALGGAIVASAVLLGGGTPAYAVTKKADGAVAVVLRDSSGIDGANSELRKLGVPAVVVPVRHGCADVSKLAVVRPSGRTTASAQAKGGEIVFGTRNVPDGATVVVTSEESPKGELTLGMLLVRGDPPKCVSMPTGGAGGPGEFGTTEKRE